MVVDWLLADVPDLPEVSLSIQYPGRMSSGTDVLCLDPTECSSKGEFDASSAFTLFLLIHLLLS